METLKLPVSNFEWVAKRDFERWMAEDIINIPSQDETGYAFEVDLHYPSHLNPVNPIFITRFCILTNNMIFSGTQSIPIGSLYRHGFLQTSVSLQSPFTKTSQPSRL